MEASTNSHGSKFTSMEASTKFHGGSKFTCLAWKLPWKYIIEVKSCGGLLSQRESASPKSERRMTRRKGTGTKGREGGTDLSGP